MDHHQMIVKSLGVWLTWDQIVRKGVKIARANAQQLKSKSVPQLMNNNVEQ